MKLLLISVLLLLLANLFFLLRFICNQKKVNSELYQRDDFILEEAKGIGEQLDKLENYLDELEKKLGLDDKQG